MCERDGPVPEAGVLHFDYVSCKRVPKDARAQRDEVSLIAPTSPSLYCILFVSLAAVCG